MRLPLALFFTTAATAIAEASQRDDPRSRKPVFSNKHLANRTVRVDSDVQFSCTVNNLGNHQVAWLHAEKGTIAVYPTVITKNSRVSVSFDKRATFSLTLSNVQEADAGKYICQINTDPMMSISGSLAVVVPPDIIDSDSSSDTLATEGMNVLLNCRAVGNPLPKITWVREHDKPIRVCEHRHNSNKFRSNDGLGRTQNSECREVQTHYGSELQLPKVSRADSGVYFCIATNNVPPTVSKRVRLYVSFPPNVFITHQRVGVQIGENVSLECLTAAYPPSLNMWVTGDDQYISERSGKYRFDTTSGEPSYYSQLMRLTIVNVSAEDFGSYRCVAKNSQGQTDGQIRLYEIESTATTTFSTINLENQIKRENISIAKVVDKIEEDIQILVSNQNHKRKQRRHKNKRRKNKEISFRERHFNGGIQCDTYWVVFLFSFAATRHV